jgi:hypothetical protein
MMVKSSVAAGVSLFALSCAAQAANVGIGTGKFYTSTLADNLAARGDNVSVLPWYDADTLAGLDVYIQDNQTWIDTALLDAFVYNGGTLVQLPWSFTYGEYTAATTVIGSNQDAIFSEPSRAISAIDPASWLLAGVDLPAAGAYTVGREAGNVFADGATQVLEWDDGTALLGYRQYGAGTVIAFNLHLTTSDASPLDAPWSNRIVYNAIGGSVSAVPEPSTYAMFGAGLLALAFVARRRAVSKG